MGNTIISSLLFQPPSPPNELDYFGSATSSSQTGNHRSAHHDAGNTTGAQSKGHSARGSSSHGNSDNAVAANNNNSNGEPSLHYIWLVSPSHPLPIPALHIQHPSKQPAATPSTQRYTLLYSHGNAEDIGLLAKFLTDIAKLLQVDILVYDYTGYGASVDRRAVLRFYAVWGGMLEEWKRWRRANLTTSASAGNVGGVGAEQREREREGCSFGAAGGGLKCHENGVCYSMDVFMAPMIFPKGTISTSACNAATSTVMKDSASTNLNLPDNKFYIGGDELDFIEEDATTVATSDEQQQQNHHRTSGGGGRSRSSASISRNEQRESSLLDIDDDYDDDEDDDMPSVTATCYENSTCGGGGEQHPDGYYYDEDDEEDEVSLFTCGASCNEVEHSSSLIDAGELHDDNDDPTVFSSSTLSSSYRQGSRSVISGSGTASAATATTSPTLSSSQRHGRRHRLNHRQGSIKAPLTPKQKRRALLRKFKWTTPSPSEEQCYGDILLAYTYLLQIQEVSPKHVLLYGKSVGSGPTCWLTQRSCLGGGSSDGSRGVAREGGMMYEDVRDDGDVDYRDERGVSGGGVSGNSGSSSSGGGDEAPGGVILHSPFLSVIRVVLDMGFTTVGDLFPNIDRVKDFTCPVYIIHGTEDEIVPYYHGQGLFNGLPDTSKTVPFWARGAGHNNIEMEMPTAYIKRLMQFIRQCDRLNYPAGELLRARAFSSGSGTGTTNPRARAFSSGSGSGSGSTNNLRRGSSQQELDNVLPNRKHSRQMSASKQRKKKGALVVKYHPETERRSSSSSHSNSNSPTMETTNTPTTKRRQGRSHRNNSMSMGKHHHHNHKQQQQQYPSVETSASTDAAMCGIQPSSVESKYYNQYLQQQQEQQQRVREQTY